jgi:hypothetical protein
LLSTAQFIFFGKKEKFVFLEWGIPLEAEGQPTVTMQISSRPPLAI